MKKVPGTASAFAERAPGGYYLDFDINRREAARYGLTVGDVQEVITSAMGGENITQTVEGLERYPVNLRYFQDYRQNLPALRRMLIPTPDGAQVPMEQVADIQDAPGPGHDQERRRPAHRLGLRGHPGYRPGHLHPEGQGSPRRPLEDSRGLQPHLERPV